MKWYDYSPMALPFVARKRNIPGNIQSFRGYHQLNFCK